MGMGHYPVTEVSDLLNHGQGLRRALDTRKKVDYRAGKDKLGPDIGVDHVQFSLSRVPEIDEDHQYRNDHADATNNGEHLEPGGSWDLQEVMSAYVGVHQQDRPESHQ